MTGVGRGPSQAVMGTNCTPQEGGLVTATGTTDAVDPARPPGGHGVTGHGSLQWGELHVSMAQPSWEPKPSAPATDRVPVGCLFTQPLCLPPPRPPRTLRRDLKAGHGHGWAPRPSAPSATTPTQGPCSRVNPGLSADSTQGKAAAAKPQQDGQTDGARSQKSALQDPCHTPG